MIENRAVTLITLVGGIGGFVLALLFSSSLLALLSAFLFAFSLLIWKYGYLIIPLFTRATQIVEVRGPYEISPKRDAMFRKAGMGWACTKGLEVLFFETTEGKSKEEKRYLFEAFEHLLSSFKYPVKLSFVIAPQEISAYTENLKAKRSELEEKLNDCESEADRRNLERKIKAIDSLIERITLGEKPIDVIAYVFTTAYGTTKEDAEIQAERQIKELTALVSSALHAQLRELKDLDLIRAIELEYFLPENREKLRDEVF